VGGAQRGRLARVHIESLGLRLLAARSVIVLGQFVRPGSADVPTTLIRWWGVLAGLGHGVRGKFLGLGGRAVMRVGGA
jgi:hypothetical protein